MQRSESARAKVRPRGAVRGVIRSRTMLGLRISGLLALAVLAAGCGDFTDAVGDEGLIRVSIYSNHEISADDLRNVGIVAGHPQKFDVTLTETGRQKISRPDDLTYTLTPDPGVAFALESGGPPDFTITVPETGMFRLDAIDQGMAVDGVDLRFETVASFELVVKVRAPFTEDFVVQPSGQTSMVTEGSEVVFIPVPRGADGERLAGDVVSAAAFDPAWTVVPDIDVEANWENGILTSKGEGTFYIIEPGTITLTVTDTVGGGSGQHVFAVAPIMP